MKKIMTFFFAAALFAAQILVMPVMAAPEETALEETTQVAGIDMSAWQYEESKDVYWQVGVEYCADPADASYETLGIYVPGAYFTASDNGDGTYTCEVNPNGAAGGYTVSTAPLVIPVNTAGYSAQSAPTKFTNEAATFAAEGIIYVYPGCRGRDSGAPAGATDLKAAIRYIRSNSDILPGDMEKIFAFGHSGGGAQTAILGASGDSSEYDVYLESIGAVMTESDAIYGAMCWCPITSLDYADEAYEWNMGLAREDLIPDMQTASENLAAIYAQYINELQLEDADGNVLTLEETEDGYWQAGSYYDYVIGIVEDSVNAFLANTEFPYTASSVSSGPGGGGMPTVAETPADGTELKESGESVSEEPGDSDNGESAGEEAGGSDNGESAGEEAAEVTDKDAGNAAGGPAGNAAGGSAGGPGAGDSADSASGETYETAEAYIESLNAKESWIEYDADSNTVKVISLSGFAKAAKTPTKDVGAFDTFELSSAENTLFGEGNGAEHFDVNMTAALEGTPYADQFAVDLNRTDALGITLTQRMNIYNPMYYISDYYDGCGSASTANFWRIRTGISQGDTSINVEINLAAALRQYGCDVDFATVWQKGHETAEITGDSTTNFIAWIAECLNK